MSNPDYDRVTEELETLGRAAIELAGALRDVVNDFTKRAMLEDLDERHGGPPKELFPGVTENPDEGSLTVTLGMTRQDQPKDESQTRIYPGSAGPSTRGGCCGGECDAAISAPYVKTPLESRAPLHAPRELLRLTELGNWLRLMDYGGDARHWPLQRRYWIECQPFGIEGDSEPDPDAWGDVAGGPGSPGGGFMTDVAARSFMLTAQAISDSDRIEDDEKENLFWFLLAKLGDE